MEKILLPRQLSHTAVFELTLRLRSFPDGSQLKIELPEDIWVTPLGMLISCAALTRFDLDLPSMASSGLGYVRFMGWASCLGDFTSPGSMHTGDTYIPIKKIELDTSGNAWREDILTTSNDLARLITSKTNLQHRAKKTLFKWIGYAFRELLRNAPEHAETGEVWVTAQYLPKNDSLEIAVLDKGIGVLRSLSKNPAIKVSSYTEALLKAVNPGVSSIPDGCQDKNDEWGNTGYGLYVLSRLATETGGAFELLSGGKVLTMRGSLKNTKDAFHSGTAIGITIKPNRLEKFDKYMSKILPEGERLSNRKASLRTRIGN